MLGTAVRYFVNAVNLARRQGGWRHAAGTAASLAAGEAAKVPRLTRLLWQRRGGGCPRHAEAPIVDVPELLAQLERRGVELRRVTLETSAFARHLASFPYPRFYAGGAVVRGGFREAKILEYFASLQLLPISPSDLVIDVASERSLFPEMVEETIGATVLRQDLAYPPGRNGDRLGGSADAMPLPDAVADRIFLHNSFEHFEGDVDTRFVAEAARVLKPGGAACIVPLYLSTRPQIVTDPLVDRSGIAWDAGAEVVERVGHRNRFGRCYSVETLADRVLRAAERNSLRAEVCHFEGVDSQSPDPFQRAHRGLRFGLVLRRPGDDGRQP